MGKLGDHGPGIVVTWLNIAFLILTAVFLIRFVSTGGIPMLRMMGGYPGVKHGGHDSSDRH